MARTAVCGIALACAGSTPSTRQPAPETASATPFLRASTTPFLRALIEPDDVDSAFTAESTLALRYDSLAPAGATWFEAVPDTGKVLLVAPHATSQIREGRVKVADAGSGSLAITLARLTGSTVIHTTYRSPSDPNYYDDNDFKRRVRELVDSLHPALVLDLHASHWRRPYDVDFGTMGGQSLRGREDLLLSLARALTVEGLINLSQDRFAASANQTVTKWVSEMGVPAVQLEINSVWLLHAEADKAQQHRFAELLQGLTRFIGDLQP